MAKRLQILLVLLFLLAGFSQPASAQTPVSTYPDHLAVLELDLRPEFDQPSMLVIYHMVLDSNTKLPATLKLTLPASVREPSAVAWVDPADGNLYSLAYNVEVSGENTYLTFTTTSPEVQVEYYDPALTQDGEKRLYQFNWPGEFDIDNMAIHIQQPMGAENMKISPSLGSPKLGQNEVKYYYSQLGAVTKGTSFNLSMQYEKKDKALSIEQLKVESSAPLNDTTFGRTSMTELMPWIIGILVLLLLISLVVWIRLVKYNPNHQRKQNRHKSSVLKFNDGVDDEPTYCHQCGQRAEKGDLFCRLCGEKIRQ